MRAIAALFLLLCGGPALAQSPALRAALFGGNYLGPGDVISGANPWYGLRAYNHAAAVAGSKAINIRRASDNATKDIVVLLTGALDVATAQAFCSGTSCFVTEAYDQTGNGNNALQATAADQPQLVFNCLVSLPCMSFASASSQALVSTSAGNATGTMSGVGKRSGNFAAFNTLVAGSSGGGLFWSGSANTTDLGQGGSNLTQTATDSAWHSVQGVGDGTGSGGSILMTDGTATTGTLGADSFFGANLTLGATNGSSFLQGSVTEGGYWNLLATQTQLKSLCHNQFLYWGTSVAC